MLTHKPVWRRETICEPKSACAAETRATSLAGGGLTTSSLTELGRRGSRTTSRRGWRGSSRRLSPPPASRRARAPSAPGRGVVAGIDPDRRQRKAKSVEANMSVLLPSQHHPQPRYPRHPKFRMENIFQTYHKKRRTPSLSPSPASLPLSLSLTLTLTLSLFDLSLSLQCGYRYFCLSAVSVYRYDGLIARLLAMLLQPPSDSDVCSRSSSLRPLGSALLVHETSEQRVAGWVWGECADTRLSTFRHEGTGRPVSRSCPLRRPGTSGSGEAGARTAAPPVCPA